MIRRVEMMRVLALDVGERRVGVAVSDPTRTVARPVGTLERGFRAADFAAIADLVAEHDAGLVVVGRPLTLRGEVGPQARQVERYAQALAESLPVPVQLWDERYSTATAEEVLRRMRKKGKRRGQGEVDAVAAAVILQGFLDSHAWEEGEDG
ncbi:MAG TPA: Holliday junction resolvase RuvX [Anaerolineae bacterium]|nr:Holliday junction resolvase RuvX [Anaerolineae bacterium]